MTQIRYDIIPRNGGWHICCNQIVGPAYNRKAEATRDALWIAELLRNGGDHVDVYVRDSGQTAPRRLSVDVPPLPSPSQQGRATSA